MNLIICMTPLQVLIAKEVVKDRYEDSFIGLYMTYNNNEKHSYYYEILKKTCRLTSFILLENESFIKRINTFYRLQRQLRSLDLSKRYIDCIFLASVDTMFVQYIVSKVRFNKLITFDDGTANIFQNSCYFIQQEQSLSKKIFRHLLSVKYNTVDDMKNISSLHYTIYPNEKNIIDNVKTVSVFSRLSSIERVGRIEKYRTKRIILGQPLESFIGINNYKEIVLDISKNLNINYYFPHPRESTRFNEVLLVIDSCLIIEDYLVEELSIDHNVKFEVYTFFSSAILALNNFERIDVSIVSNALLMEKFSEAYQFFIDRDINVIDLDELS